MHRPGRGPVRRHARRQGLDRQWRDRNLHRDGPAPHFGPGDRGRHHRHGDRTNVRLMGGVAIEVDGAPVDIATTTAYKGVMFSDIPNLASIFGYTNASWTLKSDLIAEYVCRLLSHMDRRGYAICTPRLRRRSDCGRADAAPHLRLYREGQASFVQARDEEAVALEPELRARRHGLSLWRDRGRRARVQATRAIKRRGVAGVVSSASGRHDRRTSSLRRRAEAGLREG